LGIYINPLGETSARQKATTLAMAGKVVPLAEWLAAPLPPSAGGAWPVCLVDNGGFVAAGVAYSPDEREVFAAADGRPRMWLLLPHSAIEALDPNCGAALRPRLAGATNE